MAVSTTARNVLVACRPTSGTIVFRQPTIPRHQPQHPRSSAPRQSPSKTVSNSLAAPLEADLAIAKLLAHTDPNAARIPSSQPPLLKCCDGRLNPPWIARPSRATTAVFVATGCVPYAAFFAFASWIARHTRSGVSGMSISVMP